MAQERRVELTPVEQAALRASPFEAIYPPTEKLPVIVVNNFPSLGKLAALRFIEWVKANPGGVCSLPTGKTPEHFIKWVRRLLRTWDTPQTRKELESNGIDPARKPDMASLHFVQIDEFYPINPSQRNSFFWYVNRFYIRGFGLDPARALLIDCSKIALRRGESLDSVWPGGVVDLSLRHRHAATALERRQQAVLHAVDEWCQRYEDRVRELGGIGFFLGGIGPDGHIGFNIRGSDHHSTTRLAATNYETQAAAAADLGGIEIARRYPVITIGLGTITCNPGCVAIVIAAGETKAKVVADAVEREKSVLYPATALHVLPGARFYVTMGAAGALRERRLARVRQADSVSDEEAERVVVELATARRKRVLDLSPADFQGDPLAAELLRKRREAPSQLAQRVHESLVRKIERGSTTLTNARFLHTEPHHDDLMLGYLPYIVRHVRDASNAHYFACLTGGFTSVTNWFMKDQLRRLRRFIDTKEFRAMFDEGYFAPDSENGRNRDVWQYLDGVAAKNERWKDEGTARRLLRNLIHVFGECDLPALRNRLAELEHYFDTQYPGGKDPQFVQQLKAMNREWEAECLWGYFGWSCSNVFHLRLGFYTGDIFSEEPTVERDVQPVLGLLERLKPDVVTVALDPEASGPDTHYRCLQVIAEALRRHGRPDVRIWGYRNVWYRFHPAEADICVPVSLNMFSIMEHAFLNTFNSQRDASFPSYEHDGPFCELAQKVQVEQYQQLKVCLGREWFQEHPSALIRATRGLVFLRELSLDAFDEVCRKLRDVTEEL